jgi:hypothetical protein
MMDAALAAAAVARPIELRPPIQYVLLANRQVHSTYSLPAALSLAALQYFWQPMRPQSMTDHGVPLLQVHLSDAN